MSRFEDAISWLPGEVSLELFVVHGGASLTLAVPAHLTQPQRVRVFPLEEEEGRHLLGARVCTEYGLLYTSVPAHVAEIVAAVLSEALALGSPVAWGAFEGSFHFDHLLTADIADQVYAVADASGVDLALDDDRRHSAPWADRVASARRQIVDERPESR